MDWKSDKNDHNIQIANNKEIVLTMQDMNLHLKTLEDKQIQKHLRHLKLLWNGNNKARFSQFHFIPAFKMIKGFSSSKPGTSMNENYFKKFPLPFF